MTIEFFVNDNKALSVNIYSRRPKTCIDRASDLFFCVEHAGFNKARHRAQ